MENNDLLEQGNDSGAQSTPQTPSQEQTFDPKKFVPIERFNGLQGSVQKFSTENRDLKVKLQDISTERETLSVQLEALQKEKEALTGSLKQESEQARTLAEKATGELESLKKIVTEFPELSQFYAKGLLRTDGLSGDDLTKYLSDYKEALGTLQTQAKQEFVAGSTPSSSSNNGATQSSQELYETLMKMSVTDPKYKEIQQQYVNVLREEQKSG